VTSVLAAVAAAACPRVAYRTKRWLPLAALGALRPSGTATAAASFRSGAGGAGGVGSSASPSCRRPGQAAAVPPVVYIAGSGRSGSTLLERAIGAIPGFVNVGEASNLFRWVAPLGERCGCGELFPDCPFWSAVGARAFGGWDREHMAVVHQLQDRVVRQRRMPQLMALPHGRQRFRDDHARYGEVHASLYRAIAAEAGADYVVDASKLPVQALALARSGIDVRVIHLVRDVRGVAYSLGKQHVIRPQAIRETDVMTHYAPANAAARWVACQSETELLKRCGLPVTRMRYEDFVRQPRSSIETALTDLGLPPTPSGLAHIGEGSIVLGKSHGLSGNPSRFREGTVTLRADEEWRSQMSARDRGIVTAIGLAYLLRYGRGGAELISAKQVRR
jgi:hypothetical protein